MGIRWSNERHELAAALATAQGQIKAAKRSNKAGSRGFTYQYSSLEDIWDVARKPLSENGLSVIQIPSNDEDGRIFIETTVLHSSGQWVSSGPMYLPQETGKMNALQALGSAITYARRYQLSAMVGISNSTEDDDGQAGGERTKHAPQSKPDQPAAKGNGDGAWAELLDQVQQDLGLNEPQVKAIVSDLRKTAGFTSKKIEDVYNALAEQTVSPSCEAALLVAVNAQADAYYKNRFHLANAIAKIELGVPYPPVDADGWDAYRLALIDYATAGKETE